MSMRPRRVCRNGHIMTPDNSYQAYQHGKKDGVKCRTCQKRVARETKLRLYYGISPERYQEMLIEHDNKCRICRTDRPGGMGSWHVDHCHVTNVVRGLLCSNCNTALGKAKDSIAILQAMIDYLKLYQ